MAKKKAPSEPGTQQDGGSPPSLELTIKNGMGRTQKAALADLNGRMPFPCGDDRYAAITNISYASINKQVIASCGYTLKPGVERPVPSTQQTQQPAVGSYRTMFERGINSSYSKL